MELNNIFKRGIGRYEMVFEFVIREIFICNGLSDKTDI